MLSKESLVKINPELWYYLEVKIFPQYAQNDAGHRLDHIEYVMRRSIDFADYVEKHDNSYHLNYDVVIIAAAYHDLGHHVDPKKHEEGSVQMLENGQTIRNFLTPNELRIAKRAIRQHRSHNSVCSRDIYSKILASADCNVNIDTMLRRTYAYRVKNRSSSTLDEMIEDSRQHLIEKYGAKGYARDKMFFPDPEFEKALRELQELTAEPARFRKRYLKANGLESSFKQIRHIDTRRLRVA